MDTKSHIKLIKIFEKVIPIILVILFSLTSCNKQSKNNPRYSIKSKWISDSGDVTIYIINNNIGKATIEIENKIVYLDVTFGINDTLLMCYDYKANSIISDVEIWNLKCKSKTFTATVKETTYFEIGQKIVFKLVEENVDESEIPYPPHEETDEGEAGGSSLSSSVH